MVITASTLAWYWSDFKPLSVVQLSIVLFVVANTHVLEQSQTCHALCSVKAYSSKFKVQRQYEGVLENNKSAF